MSYLIGHISIERMAHLEDKAINDPRSLDVAHTVSLDKPTQNSIVTTQQLREDDGLATILHDKRSKLRYHKPTIIL
jgi:hypothetical protein